MSASKTVRTNARDFEVILETASGVLKECDQKGRNRKEGWYPLQVRAVYDGYVLTFGCHSAFCHDSDLRQLVSVLREARRSLVQR